MVESIIIHFLWFAFALNVVSAVGHVVIHKLFWPDPPPGIQMLADFFMGVLTASAKIILGV
ncbi:MAG: hypothetical protein QOC84_2128 [Bradyrhizobium sp.]|jgi:hypothetical protein|nr:hypothetical protein [Bradyrhizobium sp.]